MIRRRFLAVAATAILTMGIDPFEFGRVSGEAMPVALEFQGFVHDVLVVTAKAVGVEYSDLIADYPGTVVRVDLTEAWEHHVEDYVAEIIHGTPGRTPRGLLHG